MATSPVTARRSQLFVASFCSIALLGGMTAASQIARETDVLRSTDGLPAHVVGLFREPVAFQQSINGDYYVLYCPRVLGQWFDGIRFYAAASRRPEWRIRGRRLGRAVAYGSYFSSIHCSLYVRLTSGAAYHPWHDGAERRWLAAVYRPVDPDEPARVGRSDHRVQPCRASVSDVWHIQADWARGRPRREPFAEQWHPACRPDSGSYYFDVPGGGSSISQGSCLAERVLT